MNELFKTIGFVCLATALAGVAWSTHVFNQPTHSADFEWVGKPFFEDFDSSTQARSLHVAAVDPVTGEPERFTVEIHNDLWVIPTHFNYPAEAADRLAATASSLIGIERESLAGRLASEHARLGVVDPLDDEFDDPESVGRRITLKNSVGDSVVDLIVGKKADDVESNSREESFENTGAQNYFYVRRPGEKQTYRVALNLDLSTKFLDWIDPDLLQVERNELMRIQIDNFVLTAGTPRASDQVAPIVKSQGDQLTLVRDNVRTPWVLQDLNSESEEFQAPRANEIMGVLDEMTIVGVRPKFRYLGKLMLTPDLRVYNRPEFRGNRKEFGEAQLRLQRDLQLKGFNLVGGNANLDLVGENGELSVGTDKGVVYTLHFGKTFEGDEKEIEIGELSGGDSTSQAASGETGSIGSDKDNKYLMIRLSLDESLIPGRPTEPQKPVPPVAPEGYSSIKSDGTAVVVPSIPDDDAAPVPDDAVPDLAPTRDAAYVQHDRASKAYEQLAIEYELAMTKFEDDENEFAVKVKEGLKRVDMLNERFGAWYYVISAKKLGVLQSKRHDLVSPKKPTKAPRRIAPKLPVIPDISYPEGR